MTEASAPTWHRTATERGGYRNATHTPGTNTSQATG
jgi:hypothetical protein